MDLVGETNLETSNQKTPPLPLPTNGIAQKRKNAREKTKREKKEKQSSKSPTPQGENNQSTDSKEKRKRNHRIKIENRASIQEMVDYNNSQVRFYDIRLNPFSRFTVIKDNFKIISFDGHPVKHMVLCTVCNAVLLRDKKTTLNLLRHLKRHGISSGTRTISRNNESKTTPADTSLPVDSAVNGPGDENTPRLKLVLDDA